MVDINTLFRKGNISKISDLESEKYVDFFSSSYNDNLEHSKKNLEEFPRWSIISGYYAMHDITKLFLAKHFRIKVEFEVHSTTIEIFKELIKNKELAEMMEKGYKEFLALANDLEEAKKERIKVQYYTGSKFLKEEYKKRAGEFFSLIVQNFIKKMEELI